MPSSRQLRILKQGPHGHDIDLVLVGGLGGHPVEEWAITTQPWQRLLEDTGLKVRLVTFDTLLTVNDDFSLESISEEAKALLDCLQQHQTTQAEICPFIFMCHSLGCSILKQALCIANAQSQSFAMVLHATLAIIFLGGPNPRSICDKEVEMVVAILVAVNSKLSKQCLARVREGFHVLVNISRLFQDIQLNVEILSLYESSTTKVKVGRKEAKGLFSSSRKMILVDRRLAATGTPKEQQWELDGDHAGLCKLQQTNGRPDRRLKEWVNFILSPDSLEAANRRIRSAIIPESPTVSLTSISSYDATRIALSSEPLRSETTQPQSNEPTMGSSTGKNWEIVPIINNLATPRKHARLPCFMMETLVRNKDFFGRTSILEELDTWLIRKELDDSAFLAQPNTQRHVVLCGMGGIGKTSIAMEFAFTRQAHFDAVFWIRADGTAKLEGDFAQIASALGLEDTSEPSDPIVRRELAMGWLANPKKVLDHEDDIISLSDARWLLIFDNADTPELLQDYWPLSTIGSILVTSRDPLSKSTPSIAYKSIDLEPLSEQEGAQLLQRLSHSTQESGVSLTISKRLGGLPLAISQMAGIMRHQYLTPSDFLERYDDDPSRKQLHAYEQAGARRQETRGTVASIWAVEQLEQGAKALIQLCSILDPDCIQERIFDNFNLGKRHIQGYPQNLMAYSTARAELLKRSLVKRNETTKELWVHRVLQDSVQGQMSSDRLLSVFSLAVYLIINAWGSTPLEKRHVLSLSKSRAGLFPHALALKSTYEKYYMVEQSKNQDLNAQLAILMNEAGWWQHERGSSHESKALWSLALQICDCNTGLVVDHLLADIHYGLSAAANETNDARSCLKHTQILLNMRMKAVEESKTPDIRLAIAHNEIGIAWVMNLQYEEAIAAYESSIEVYKVLKEFQLAIDTNPRTNLGFTYWAMGNLEAGWTTLHSLLHDRQERFGLDDTESYRTGRVYHGLGNIRYDQGLFEESEQLHQRALAHYQFTLGNNHHKTADLCHRVAQHCFRRGELTHARTLINQALKIWRSKEKVFCPEIARTTFLQAKLEMQAGNGESATILFKEARDLRNSILGSAKIVDVSLDERDFDRLVTFFSR